MFEIVLFSEIRFDLNFSKGNDYVYKISGFPYIYIKGFSFFNLNEHSKSFKS